MRETHVRAPGRDALAGYCGTGREASGGQLFVKFEGKVVTECAYGANGDGTPLTDTTLFPSNCLTKPVVAIALLGLLEQAHVDVCTRVSDILPEDLCWSTGAPSWLPTSSIRIADILNHSAGLLIPSAYELLMVSSDRADQLVTAAPEPQHPGYSDYMGWWIVELLIQQLAGRDAHLHICNEVLVPNELSDGIILSIPKEHLVRYEHRLGVWVGKPPRSVPFLSMMLPEFVARHRPAFSGLITMSALGRFYGLVSDSLALAGPPPMGFPSGHFLRKVLRQNRGTIYDRGLRKYCDFGAGFALDMRRELQADISRDSLGHGGGFIPSIGFVDVHNDVIVAAYLNGMTRDFAQLEFIRSQLVNSVYRDLGVTGTDDVASLW